MDEPAVPPTELREHEQYMRRCIDLAERALVTGDAPVGAVIVRHGDVVAEGVEGVRATADVTAHAEIVALRAACGRLGSLDLGACTLYTSVEPCVMCAYAIRLARIGTVVAGARTPQADSPLSGWSLLTSTDILPHRPPPAVVRDVLGDECRAS